jgi:hypothetical protein
MVDGKLGFVNLTEASLDRKGYGKIRATPPPTTLPPRP